MPSSGRSGAAAFSIAILVATASPVVRRPYDDGFPLSPYAMFATKRPTRLTIDYPLGVTDRGERRVLSPSLVGSAEVLQALEVVKRARASRSLPALCAAIAARVATSDEHADVVAIRIVSGTHDAVDFFVRDTVGPEIEHTRCDVARGGTR